MSIKYSILSIESTQQFEIINITKDVQSAVQKSGVQSGVVVVSTPHTTAGIKLNHYEPLLLQDMMRTLHKLAPQDISYNHDVFELKQNTSVQTRSNGHAHIKAFLLGATVSLPIQNGQVVLGDRQSVLFIECDGARKRRVDISILGE